MTTASNNKHALRKHFRKLRRGLALPKKQQAAKNIAELLLTLPEYQKAKHIGVYSALAEEASLDVFTKRAWEDGKSVYLPVVAEDSTNNEMDFEAWFPQSKLHISALGISEPKPITNPKNFKQKPSQLDLILLPLVAYDKCGRRLGMGAGFYDRYLEKYHTNNCPLIGIAFSCQEASNLPHDTWDKNLDILVNEKNILYFN